MGNDISSYITTTEDDNLDSKTFTCYVCSEIKNNDEESQIYSQSCKHTCCLNCVQSSSPSFPKAAFTDSSVVTIYVPGKHTYKIPGLCPICFVANVMRSKNFPIM